MSACFTSVILQANSVNRRLIGMEMVCGINLYVYCFCVDVFFIIYAKSITVPTLLTIRYMDY